MLVFEPTFLFFVKKYRFKLFLKIIKKKAKSKITSKTNRYFMSMCEKDNNFGLIKAKNVSIHRPMQIIESESTNLKPFNLLYIKNINNLYKHNIV